MKDNIALKLAALASTILIGCQGKLATMNYTIGFEGPIMQMYEEHVLANLARRAEGRFIVQMSFGNFSSSVTYGNTVSGELQFFDTKAVAEQARKTTIALNPAFWSISPTIGSALTGTVGFIANPALDQTKILAAYDDEIARDETDRIFVITTSAGEAGKGYRRVRVDGGQWAYVPQNKINEFCAFVTKVSFWTQEPSSPTTQMPLRPSFSP